MSVREQTNGHDVSAPVPTRTRRLPPVAPAAGVSRWACGQDRPQAMVQAALVTLARAGEPWRVLPAGPSFLAWAREAAALVAGGGCDGVVLFCADPSLAACVANKTPGVRAAAVTTVGQAAAATLTLAANLLAVEMPGRTFFEVRFILQTLRASRAPCPAEVARTLAEMEHAHR